MSDKVLRYMLVAVKEESSEGTDAFGGSPGASDWLAAFPETMITEVRNQVRDTTVRPYHTNNAKQSHPSHCEVEVHIPLIGKEAASGDAPPAPVLALYKSAGHKGTTAAGTSFTLTPITFHTNANAPTCTVYTAEYLSDGTVRTHVAVGVRLVWSLNASEGLIRQSFVGQGLYSDPDESPIAAPSNPASYSEGKTPFLSQGMSAAIGSEDFDLIDYSISSNFEVVGDNNITGTNLMDRFELVRGEDNPPVSSFNFRQASDLEYVLGQWDQDSELALDCSWTDGTDDVQIIGTGQFGDYSRSKGNIQSYSSTLGHIATAADAEDDYSIVFT